MSSFGARLLELRRRRSWRIAVLYGIADRPAVAAGSMPGALVIASASNETRRRRLA